MAGYGRVYQDVAEYDRIINGRIWQSMVEYGREYSRVWQNNSLLSQWSSRSVFSVTSVA